MLCLLVIHFSQHDKKWENEYNLVWVPLVLGAHQLAWKQGEKSCFRMLTSANFAIKLQAVNSSRALKVLDPVISLTGINQKEITLISITALYKKIVSARLFIIQKEKKRRKYSKYLTIKKRLGNYYIATKMSMKNICHSLLI